MTKLNLSQKLYVDKKGKRFAYADDIQKAVRDLKGEYCMNEGIGEDTIEKDFCSKGDYKYCDNCKKIDKFFGDELK